MRPLQPLTVLAGLALGTAAHADQILYHNDFESGTIDSHWGSTAHLDQSNALFTKFMGRYSANTPPTQYNNVTLTIPAAPGDTGSNGAGEGYVLHFDFYCIDSWDGNSTTIGPDVFDVIINSVNCFSHTFTNNPGGYTQNYAVAPTIGPALLGFNAADRDSIYRDIAIPFTIGTAQTITFQWRSTGLQGMQDESWGIDNVSVNYVPTPGSLALLGLSGLALGRRRRA